MNHPRSGGDKSRRTGNSRGPSQGPGGKGGTFGGGRSGGGPGAGRGPGGGRPGGPRADGDRATAKIGSRGSAGAFKARKKKPAGFTGNVKDAAPERVAFVFNFEGLAALTPPQIFLDQADSLGIEFEPGDVEKLGLYLAMLLQANEAINLTAIRDAEAGWERHILDSLTLLSATASLEPGAKVIDVGSGGGLPGLPLAIVCPHLSFTLLEATGKKVDFLRAVVEKLGLANVAVLAERAERAGHDRGERAVGAAAEAGARIGGHRETYDLVVARAVGRLATLAELTVPFAKQGGAIALIKGEKAGEEVEEAAEALHQLKAVHSTTAQTPTGRIVVLEKRAATPKIFPRGDGEPSRSPLGVGKAKAKPAKKGAAPEAEPPSEQG